MEVLAVDVNLGAMWRWGEVEKEADHRTYYGVGHLLDRKTYFFAIYNLVCILDLGRNMACKSPADGCEGSLVQRQEITDSEVFKFSLCFY
jgi:hypothetical protein